MKKIIFLLAILLILVGCDNGTKKDPPKTIDAGLVGDKWYIGNQNIYYKFTTTQFIKTTAGLSGETAITAYTENGKVFSSDNVAVLDYEYIDPSEFDDDIKNAENDSARWEFLRLQRAAQAGNYVRFTEDGISVEWGRWARISN
jgi:uncharacterized protein YxeA